MDGLFLSSNLFSPDGSRGYTEGSCDNSIEGPGESLSLDGLLSKLGLSISSELGSKDSFDVGVSVPIGVLSTDGSGLV